MFEKLWPLAWVYLAPVKLRAYRAQHGAEALLRAGAWFGSTLLWLPGAIPVIGFYAGLAPRGTLAEGALLFALTMVLASWLLGGLIGWIDARWSTLMLGAFAGLGALGSAVTLLGSWDLGALVGTLTTLTLVAVCCVAVASINALLLEARSPALLFIAPLALRIIVIGAWLQALIGLAALVPNEWNYGARGLEAEG